MRVGYSIAVVLCIAAAATPAAGQEAALPRGAEVCISVDDAHDTLTPPDRISAQLLVEHEFELAGARVVAGECAMHYTLSHVKLGRTITVIIAGPNGRRQGMALGLDDLPALYSQMVRSIVTGRPMTSAGIVDRTNVTVRQAAPLRERADSFGYTRLGFAGVIGTPTAGATAVGFGYRAELDRIAVDVSFFNMQMQQSGTSTYYGGSRTMIGSVVKAEGLRFVHPTADASVYFGGGLAWGVADVASGASGVSTYTHGSGLQGELTVGYELARASTLRLFIQTDATIPFYRVTSQSFGVARTSTPPPPVSSLYVSSISLSVGLGWHRR